MRVILFQDRFAEKVRDGDKCQTIRGRARCRAGDVLSLRRWTGKPYRSKQEILRTARCSCVLPVVINENDIFGPKGEMDRNGMAWMDGFDDWESMREWFREMHGLPFNGEVIAWVT